MFNCEQISQTYKSFHACFIIFQQISKYFITAVSFGTKGLKTWPSVPPLKNKFPEWDAGRQICFCCSHLSDTMSLSDDLPGKGSVKMSEDASFFTISGAKASGVSNQWSQVMRREPEWEARAPCWAGPPPPVFGKVSSQAAKCLRGFHCCCFYAKHDILKKLKYSWFTVFQAYSKVIQLYIYFFVCLFCFHILFHYYKILNILPCAITVGPCWLSVLYIVVCIC